MRRRALLLGPLLLAPLLLASLASCSAADTAEARADSPAEPGTTVATTAPPTTSPPTTSPPETAPPTTAPVRRAPTTTEAADPPADTPAEPNAGCHPSYVGACLPVDSADVDCASGSGNGPDYTSVRRFQVVGPDVYGLDRDGDGIACES